MNTNSKPTPAGRRITRNLSVNMTKHSSHSGGRAITHELRLQQKKHFPIRLILKCVDIRLKSIPYSSHQEVATDSHRESSKTKNVTVRITTVFGLEKLHG